MPKYGAVPTITSEFEEDSPEVPIHQGHAFCGCLCGMRMAVILLDSLMVLSLLVDLLGLFAIEEEVLDDDELERLADQLPIGAMTLIFGLQILCYGYGIYGACSYSIGGPIVALTTLVITIGMNTIVFNLVAILIASLVAYPHIVLIYELRTGILSPPVAEYYDE